MPQLPGSNSGFDDQDVVVGDGQERDPQPTSDVEIIPLASLEAALNLAGSREANLKLIARLNGSRLTLRGQDLMVKGSLTQRQQVREWVNLVQTQGSVSRGDAEVAYQAVLNQQVAAYRQAQNQKLTRTLRGEMLRPKTPAQRAYVQAIQDFELVFGVGPAGTGKTYLATVMAVMALQERRCERLVLTRPAVEAGEKLGFLPGDLREKVDPYLRPLYDSLHDLITPDQVLRMIEHNTIEIAPLAYMRGRTLTRAFVILDEAQNTTPEQMKMILTRLGEGSRMVVTGDLSQTDLGSRQTSGLASAIQVLTGTEGIAFCYLKEEDVIRHPLVRKIVTAYNRFDEVVLSKKDKS